MALLFAVLVPLAVQASSSGVAKSGCSTGACHAKKASGDVSVSVSGPAQLAVGETATYTLTVGEPGGFSGGGFSVTANGGASVSVVDPNTVQVNGNVSHSGANVGVWSYNFNVTAPSVVGASINITFAGLAFDGDGSATTADIWNTGSYVVSVIGAVPEPATGLLVSLGIGMLAVAGRRRKA